MTPKEKKLENIIISNRTKWHMLFHANDATINDIIELNNQTIKQILELDLVLEAKTHKEQYDDFRRAVDKIRELKQEITRYKEALVEIINADNKDSESCGICGRLAKQALMKG